MSGACPQCGSTTIVRWSHRPEGAPDSACGDCGHGFASDNATAAYRAALRSCADELEALCAAWEGGRPAEDLCAMAARWRGEAEGGGR